MLKLFFLLVFFISISGLQSQHQLRYQLKLGESFKVEQIAVQKMDQDLDGTIYHNTNNDLNYHI